MLSIMTMKARATNWVSRNPFIVAVIAAIVWLLIIVVFVLPNLPFWLPDWLRNNMGELHVDTLRGLGFYIAGVGIAPIGLYIAMVRANALEDQLDNDRKRRLGEEFSKSVELLGNEQAAARQGGIYALAYLAKEDKERYATIIKIVASYVRQTGDKDNKYIKPQGIDIEAALSVIKNRDRKMEKPPQKPRQYTFDLSNAHLVDGDLSHTTLEKVNMSDIVAYGCAFENTKFLNMNMVAAKFIDCDFRNAIFAEFTELAKVRFTDCAFENTEFHGAGLSAAKFDGADFHGADLSAAKGLTQEQINSIKGNSKTKLPAGLKRPSDWN